MPEKSLAQKLLVKPGYRVMVVNAPEGYAEALDPLPSDVTVLAEPAAHIDLIQVFVKSKQDLIDQLARLKDFLTPKVLLWVTYPKGTSRVKTDINRDIINEYATSVGLQGVAMIAIDETWSALRLKQI